MHLLILLVLAVLIALLITSLRPKGDSGNDGAATHRNQGLPWNDAGSDGGTGSAQPGHRLAFVSRGKLFHWAPGQPVREVQSPYVQGVMDRLERSRRLHGWKQGTAFGSSFARREPMQADESGAQAIQATSAQFLGPDRVLYFLKDDKVGGLFEQDLADGTERRLVHKQHLAFEDMKLNPDKSRLLCAQHASNGTANIAVLNADGSDYREITGGDTIDTAPAWIPGDAERVVFQCTGLARDPNGYAIARGPASIQMVNLKQGELTTVLEDPKLDFLQPRVSPDGALYFIRRPYELPRYDAGSALMDALLFPFRLLRALFHYLNFFSLMYTRKPLTTASGPAQQADLKQILLKGKRVDAEEALRKGALVSGVPSLVPASWQLLCRSRNGQEQVLASHVSSFDIADDGTVLFSNGTGVFVVDGSRSPRVLLRDQLIADLIAGHKTV